MSKKEVFRRIGETDSKLQRRIHNLERRIEEQNAWIRRLRNFLMLIGWTLVWGSISYDFIAPLLLKTRLFSSTYNYGFGLWQFFVWGLGISLVLISRRGAGTVAE